MPAGLLYSFKMEPWWAADAHNGGEVEHCRVVCRSVAADLHHFDEEQDPDRHKREMSDTDPHESVTWGSASLIASHIF